MSTCGRARPKDAPADYELIFLELLIERVRDFSRIAKQALFPATASGLTQAVSLG